MKPATVRLTVLAIALGVASAALANPVMIIAISETAAPGQVSVFNCPNGQGKPMTEAFYRQGPPGATPNVVDATITVVVMDENENPIPGIPAEEIWLETSEGGLVFCAGGNIADHATNPAGQTQFTGTIHGGGATDPDAGEGTVVYVVGEPTWNPPLDIQFNSSDMNRDLIVDLSDIVQFVTTYLGDYAYRADFYWDGVMNLTDIVLLAQNYGAYCP